MTSAIRLLMLPLLLALPGCGERPAKPESEIEPSAIVHAHWRAGLIDGLAAFAAIPLDDGADAATRARRWADEEALYDGWMERLIAGPDAEREPLDQWRRLRAEVSAVESDELAVIDANRRLEEWIGSRLISLQVPYRLADCEGLTLRVRAAQRLAARQRQLAGQEVDQQSGRARELLEMSAAWARDADRALAERREAMRGILVVP